MKFLQINRDPDPAEQSEGASTLEEAMNLNLGGEPGEEGKPKEEPKKEEKKETPADEIEIEGYKGKDRRGKAYAGDKRRKGEDDPEIDLGFEREEGKGTKAKLSEIKNSIKWLLENGKTIAGSMKIREMALANPSFHKLMSTVIEKSFGDGDKFNADFADKAIKALEAKEEKIEEDIEDKDDEIKKAEDLLNSDEIDADSVQARVLRGNIAAMKFQRTQLQTALGKIDEISKKLTGIEEGQNQFKSQKSQEEHDGEVKRLSGMFEKEFGALTDKDKTDGYKFINDDEAKEFENLVRTAIGNQAKDLKTDEDFVKSVKAHAKSVYEMITKRRETIVNDYIKKKGGKVEPKKETKKEDDEEENTKDMNVGDLSDSIEKMLKESKE